MNRCYRGDDRLRRVNISRDRTISESIFVVLVSLPEILQRALGLLSLSVLDRRLRRGFSYPIAVIGLRVTAVPAVLGGGIDIGIGWLWTLGLLLLMFERSCPHVRCVVDAERRSRVT